MGVCFLFSFYIRYLYLFEVGVEVGGCIMCYLYVFEEFGLAGSFGIEILYVVIIVFHQGSALRPFWLGGWLSVK